MQSDDYLAQELSDLNEAVRAQTAGLTQLMRYVVQQQGMLKEILAAITAPEPEEPSPLVKLILRLNESIESQATTLTRIERAVAGPASR